MKGLFVLQTIHKSGPSRENPIALRKGDTSSLQVQCQSLSGRTASCDHGKLGIRPDTYISASQRTSSRSIPPNLMLSAAVKTAGSLDRRRRTALGEERVRKSEPKTTLTLRERGRRRPRHFLTEKRGEKAIIAHCEKQKDCYTITPVDVVWEREREK